MTMNLLKKILSQRFNPLERETAHKLEFKNSCKQKDESVSDYGHALRRLASQAYPSLDLVSIEALVVDQFVEELGNRDLKWYVQLINRPKTLDQAISYAIEYEAFEGPLENIKKPQFSDEVTYHTYVIDQDKQTEDQNLEKKIKNIIIYELKNENKSTAKETEKKILDENICIKKPVNENNKKRSLIICYYCGKRGHIQTRCLKQNRRTCQNKILGGIEQADLEVYKPASSFDIRPKMKRNGRLEFDDLAKSSFQSLYVPVEINNINLEMITDTDANLSGISGILSQEQENSEKVISFASHTLNKGQRNYCVTKHELLAVVTFVRQFRHFLWGRKFIIYELIMLL